MNIIFNIIYIIFMIVLLVLLGAIIKYLLKGARTKSINETIEERKEKINKMFENIFLICVFTILVFGVIFILTIPLFEEVIHIYPQNSEQNLLICY